MKNTTSKLRVQKKILLKLGLVEENDLQQCIEVKREIQDQHDISLPLPTILYHRNLLSEENLRNFHTFFQENFSHLSPSLPIPLQYEFLSEHPEENLEQSILETDEIKQEYVREARAIRDELQEKNLSLTTGEILIHSGKIDPDTLRKCVVENKISSIDSEEPKTQSESDRTAGGAKEIEDRLGDLAIEHNFLTEQQLDQALSLQSQFRQKGVTVPLGQILESLDLLTQEEVKELLKIQQVLRKKEIKEVINTFQGSSPDRPEEDYLGNLALQENLLTRNELNECLQIQKELEKFNITKRIGEILKEKGYISENDLQRLLAKQKGIPADDEGNIESESSSLEGDEIDQVEEQLRQKSVSTLIDAEANNFSLYYGEITIGLFVFLVVGTTLLILQPWQDNTGEQTVQAVEQSKTNSDPATPKSGEDGNRSTSSASSRKPFPWEKNTGNTDGASFSSDRDSSRMNLNLNGKLRFAPVQPVKASFRAYVNHEYLAGSSESITVDSTSYNLRIGPFNTGKNDEPRIPPGAYQIKHTFMKSPAPIPPPLKIQLEPFLEQELIQMLSGSKHWTRFSTHILSSKSKIGSFWNNWGTLLKNEHKRVRQAWAPFQKRLKESLKNPDTVPVSRFETLLNDIDQTAKSARNKISEARKKFVVVPYQNSTNQLMNLLEILPDRSRSILRMLLRRLEIPLPSWLNAPPASNEDTLDLHLIKIQLGKLRDRVHGALSDMGSVHPFSSLKDILRLESWRILQVQRVLDGIRNSSTPTNQLMALLQRNSWQNLKAFLQTLNSYIHLHETSIQNHQHLNDQRFARGCSVLLQVLPVYVRKQLEHLIRNRDFPLPSLVKNYADDSKFSNLNTESLRKKLRQVRTILGISSLKDRPDCKRCPESY